MDSADRAGGDWTFTNITGSEGAARLREKVNEKLKEILGDYTDDTLLDYVLLLLRNGRSKDDITKELNAFLGEDSVSFVSWLWDYLSSKFSLCAQSKDSLSDDVAKSSRPLDDQRGRQNSSPEHAHENIMTDSVHEREKLSKNCRSRHNMEWKGLVQEGSNLIPLRSTVTKILHSEERNNVRHNIRRSLSPKPQIVKKRSREDDRQPMKRGAASHPIISASRRLLQFAVRDAVRTVQQANSRPEPALKRLHSVVSTTTADSLLDERPQRLRSVARVPGALSTALKAAAEAAEDVAKDRCQGSVFDRLSHGAYVSEPIKQPSAEPMLEDGEYNHPDQILESSHAEIYQSEYDGDFTGDMTMLDRDTAMPDDSASHNDGYNNVGGVRHHGLNASQSFASANKEKESLTLHYSVAQDASEVARDTRLIDQGPTSRAMAKPSSKIVNISVNVNTWKTPHYQVPRDSSETENQAAVDKNVVAIGKSNSRLPKDNNITMTENEIAIADVQKEPQKTLALTPGSYTTNRPSDDVDSRTIFVSNVHFAATKDTLSRHFNKFGEVLKVIIVNDAATGQPKGSAYVEFLRKESAESALSLNGTYFMSRSLKVVRKSFMQQEATTTMGWPRVARASPFASRLNIAAFSRGVLPGAFRARLPMKAGARSLQWKRAGPAQTTTKGTKSTPNPLLTSGNNAPSPTGRNLTYVRPNLKVDANSGQT